MRNHTRMLILCALFAALTAVGAFLRLPAGAMSITLQFFFTAMAALLLGPRWGALSQIVYVALGLAGLPVFTQGGGPGYVFQPSFGFLLGLIPAAWVMGKLAGDGTRPWRTACFTWWASPTCTLFSTATWAGACPCPPCFGRACWFTCPATR